MSNPRPAAASRRANQTDEQRRALRIIARHPHGCDEAIILAHGFRLTMLAELVLAGFALATPRDTRAGSKPMMVVWMTITAAGQKAIST
jgi:hypothetical protein